MRSTANRPCLQTRAESSGYLLPICLVRSNVHHHARAFRTSRAWACWAHTSFLSCGRRFNGRPDDCLRYDDSLAVECRCGRAVELVAQSKCLAHSMTKCSVIRARQKAIRRQAIGWSIDLVSSHHYLDCI